MGYLLRGMRLASYLGAALGLILIAGDVIVGTGVGGQVFFAGIRILFISLVGISATSWLRDRYLEGAEEEEYYSLLPTPQIKTPNIPLRLLQLYHSLTKKEFLLGGIAGFIGELVGSFGTAMALDWGSVDSGAGYIFAILTCLGYPLIGAFLGGVSGFYTSFFLSRYHDADISLGVGIISPLFVGFVVGLLAGIAPYILLGAWYG